MNDHQFGEVWRENRPYLVDLAYRILGDIGGAEDVVQVAFTRLIQADPDGIDDPRGWLIVVTSRLCFDQVKSARFRREEARDAFTLDWENRPGEAVTDPADRVTLDDDVRLALLVVLQRLSPAERVAYVLHDVFQMPFDTVAETVGRPPATCRQLARRARAKIAKGAPTRAAVVSTEEHRTVINSFVTACSTGDLQALMAVLDPGVAGDADLGPGVPRVVRKGRHKVAPNLLMYVGPGVSLVSHPVSDQPSLLAFQNQVLFAVLSLEIDQGLVKKIHVIVDPGQVAFVLAARTGNSGASG